MILVFDVGGTGVKYGVSDEQGRFCLRDSFETPAAGLETFLNKIREIFLKTSKQWDIQGAAFSFPGEVTAGKESSGGSVQSPTYMM